MKRILIYVLVCMLVSASISMSVAGNVLPEKESYPLITENILYVGGSGPNNYTKIQDAIDDASNGDTVFVYQRYAPYKENLVIEKSISMIGQAKQTTIIDGSLNTNADVILIKADGVTVQGFTIQNAYGGVYTDYNNGIEVWSDNNIIRDNIVRDNQNGIQLGEEKKSKDHENNHSNFNIIEENTITKNRFVGVYIIYSAHNQISKNTISENRYHGIFVWTDTSQNHISQNMVMNHSQNGIWLFSSSSIIIVENHIVRNRWGVSIGGGSNNTIVANHIVDNNCGVSIHQSSVNSIKCNNIYNNRENACIASLSLTFLYHSLIRKKQWFNQSWTENYWGQPYRNPQPIICKLIFEIPTMVCSLLINRFNLPIPSSIYLPFRRFDRNPVQEPYELSDMN